MNGEERGNRRATNTTYRIPCSWNYMLLSSLVKQRVCLVLSTRADTGKHSPRNQRFTQIMSTSN